MQLQMHEKGDNYHGEWEWAGDRSGAGQVCGGTTGVCVWEQLNCKQGHAILQQQQTNA